jgi:hypothetical protein
MRIISSDTNGQNYGIAFRGIVKRLKYLIKYDITPIENELTIKITINNKLYFSKSIKEHDIQTIDIYSCGVINIELQQCNTNSKCCIIVNNMALTLHDKIVPLDQIFVNSQIDMNQYRIENKIVNEQIVPLSDIFDNLTEFNKSISMYNNILFLCNDYPGYGGAATNC